MAEMSNDWFLHVSRMEQLQINEVDLHLTHPTETLSDDPPWQWNLKPHILTLSGHH